MQISRNAGKKLGVALLFCSQVVLGIPSAFSGTRIISDQETAKINDALELLLAQENEGLSQAVKIKLVEGTLGDKGDDLEVLSAKFEVNFALEEGHDFGPAQGNVQVGLNLEDKVHAVIFGEGKAPLLGESIQDLFQLGEEKVKSLNAQFPDYNFQFKYDTYVENSHPWIYADFNMLREGEANAQASFHYNWTTQGFFFHSISEFNPEQSSLAHNFKETLNAIFIGIITNQELLAISGAYPGDGTFLLRMIQQFSQQNLLIDFSKIEASL